MAAALIRTSPCTGCKQEGVEPMAYVETAEKTLDLGISLGKSMGKAIKEW